MAMTGVEMVWVMRTGLVVMMPEVMMIPEVIVMFGSVVVLVL